MKNDGNSGKENADGLDARGDAALWDLLGRADQPKAGPYFSRRVLREVSLLAETRTAARWWQPAALWRACRRLPGVAFVVGTPVAALLLLFLGLHGISPGRQTPAVALPAPTASAEVSGLVDPVAEPPDVALSVPTAPAEASNGGEAAPQTPEVAAENVPPTPPAASVASPPLPEEVTAQDVEVIAELDTLLKNEQNRLWTEDTARF